MLFTPFNFTFSLERVAIYEWEPVTPADVPTPAPNPATCVDPESRAQQEPQSLQLPAMHLVFKGYEWASVANCGLFPRPSFEDCYSVASEVANQPVDNSENERRARPHDAARHVKPAVAAPEQVNAADEPCDTPAPCDPLKLRQR